MTAAVIATVDWSYQEVELYWSTTDFKRKLEVGERGVGLVYDGTMTLP